MDPTHLRDLRLKSGNASGDDRAQIAIEAEAATDTATADERPPGGERRRRVRDAVEAALSDVILLGTEEQVRLATKAASDLAAGRAVETAEIVVSLRTFIRAVLDLEPVPAELAIPRQGPLRPPPASRGSKGAASGGGRAGGRGGGGGAAGAGGSTVGATVESDGAADR